jgi:CheY-like chemotaxis protein
MEVASLKCVFVVDDEKVIANTLGLILRSAGFEVRTFYDGFTALEHAKSEAPDIVLSDVVMPEMDGFCLAKNLKQRYPSCRILLISGNAYSSKLHLEWTANGGEDIEILEKPVHPEVIIRKLKAMADMDDAAKLE